jgi:hypothetical protein
VTARDKSLAKCHLCRRYPMLITDWADEHDPRNGHFELDCGCGVYVYSETVKKARNKWQLLMGAKRKVK